jgi:hypothetical protein
MLTIIKNKIKALPPILWIYPSIYLIEGEKKINWVKELQK